MPDGDQASETKEDDEITHKCSDTYHTDTDKACFSDGMLSSEQNMFIIQHGLVSLRDPFLRTHQVSEAFLTHIMS